MTERTHECPGGCGRPVPYRLFACGACWARLPRSHRDAITDAYSRRRDAPLDHIRAMHAARRWYKENAR